LLRRGKAAVWRGFPFTIILKAAEPDARVQPLRLKLDPGSRSSGLAIIDDSKGRVIFAAEIIHRHECNLRKGNRPIEEFLRDSPLILERVLAQVKVPLRDATAVNATRWALYERLLTFGLPIELGTGGRTKAKTARTVHGFRTGDIVKAVVTQGKNIGTYLGRVAVRTTGSYNITTSQGTVQGISHRSCMLVQRNDGYRYERGEALFTPYQKDGTSMPLCK
jgi:hypothetical protein